MTRIRPSDCRPADNPATFLGEGRPLDAKVQERYAALLRSGRWFRGLADELQREILRIALVRNLDPGERLFSRGDPPCGLYAVVDGTIRIAGVTDEGKEVTLTLVDPPSWFGEIAVFDREARTHDAIAQTVSTVIRVPQDALEALLEASPQYWRDLALLVTAKLRLAFVALEDSSTRSLPLRLARRLLVMAHAHGEWNDRSRRVVEVRQDQLATMLGTSRQTLNAALKEYAAQGVLRVSYGQVEILDLDALRRLGAFEP
jgi:CRP-like cAMP-binding protein